MTDAPTTAQLEDNKKLARRIPEGVFAEGNLDLLDDLYAENAVEHNAFGTQHGREEIRDSYAQFLAAFPDISQTVEHVVAEGSMVAMYITSRGTNTGALMGIEPTGNEIEVQQMFFIRIEDGKIAERWFLPDTFKMLQQLELIEFPPK